MRLRILIPGAIVVGVCIAGCHHQVPQAVAPRVTSAATRAVEPPPVAAPPARVRAASAPAPLSDDELFRRKSLDELNAEHPLNDVFFDFEKDAIRDDGRTTLRQDLEWSQNRRDHFAIVAK
jgi:hypothetical protein